MAGSHSLDFAIHNTRPFVFHFPNPELKFGMREQAPFLKRPQAAALQNISLANAINNHFLK